MIQCLELALKCVQLFTENQTHLVLKAKTSDCGLSSPLMKCRQLSRSNWIATKDLRNFRGCALGRVFELRFGILTRFEGMYVCLFFVFSGVFKLGHQSVLSVFFCLVLCLWTGVLKNSSTCMPCLVAPFQFCCVAQCCTSRLSKVSIFFLLCSLFLGMQWDLWKPPIPAS